MIATGPLAWAAGASFRFTIPLLNYLFFIALQPIPFALLVIALRSWSGRRLLLSTVLTVPLVLFAGPAGCLASACVVLGGVTLTQDATYERIRAFDAPYGQIVVHRTNGGATTAFGIDVDQECTIGLSA